ncbi:MAG: hypothetical protein HY300_03125 [Verrucomicrobia bacterium]|nr:hypothetical protein [Verrucomicrobiota bacterium]
MKPTLSMLRHSSFCLLRVALGIVFACAAASAADGLQLTLQKRVEAGQGSGGNRVVTTVEKWDTKKTAIIVCDMWDLHHCLNAVRREGEMAPRMNDLLEKARAQGVFIIHAPSSCMKPYEGHPARERAKAAPKAANLPNEIGVWCKQIPDEEKGRYPIDQSDGGEDDDAAEHAKWADELKAKGLNPRAPWTRQIDVLKIHNEDAISDSGVEIWNLIEQRGIQNVILMGVHVNMCVSGVDHFRGTALFIEHIEKYICPTITSDQILGGKPFMFSGNPAGKQG